MDLRCTTADYDLLYARWLQKPGTLLRLAGFEPGMKLMDLCGGTGAVSREATQLGADPSDITLVDLNPRADELGVNQEACKAENIAWIFNGQWSQFDVVICRQAMAYLDLGGVNGINLFMAVYALLKPGGVFVFNTFIRPRWAFKRYRYKGVRYVEASAYLGRTVWHLQGIPGFGWDATKFRWHRPEVIYELGRRFEVTESINGRAQYWTLRKPGGEA